MPRDFTVELNCAVADRLDEGQKIRLANECTRFSLSSILHGEQGALSLSASLVPDPARPGRAGVRREPGARGGAPRHRLRQLHRRRAGATPLAGRPDAREPDERDRAGARGLQEARRHADADRGPRDGRLRHAPLAHQRPAAAPRRPARDDRRGLPPPFGKIWADRTVPKLSEEEHEKVEDWAAKCFQTLLFNLVNAEQKQAIYAAVRPRLAVGAQRRDGGVHRRRPAPHDDARAPTSSAC